MREFLETARERRLSGNHHENGSLQGFCFDNAFVLHNLLEEHGLNPAIVCGAAEGYSRPILDEKPVDSIDSVEELNGLVHYWIEVRGKVLDISCELDEARGEPIVRDSIPREYYRFNDSYSYAEGILHLAQNRRCSHCGGRDGYCGCPNAK